MSLRAAVAILVVAVVLSGLEAKPANAGATIGPSLSFIHAKHLARLFHEAHMKKDICDDDHMVCIPASHFAQTDGSLPAALHSQNPLTSPFPKRTYTPSISYPQASPTKLVSLSPTITSTQGSETPSTDVLNDPLASLSSKLVASGIADSKLPSTVELRRLPDSTADLNVEDGSSTGTKIIISPSLDSKGAKDQQSVPVSAQGLTIKESDLGNSGNLPVTKLTQAPALVDGSKVAEVLPNIPVTNEGSTVEDVEKYSLPATELNPNASTIGNGSEGDVTPSAPVIHTGSTAALDATQDDSSAASKILSTPYIVDGSRGASEPIVPETSKASVAELDAVKDDSPAASKLILPVPALGEDATNRAIVPVTSKGSTAELDAAEDDSPAASELILHNPNVDGGSRGANHPIVPVTSEGLTAQLNAAKEAPVVTPTIDSSNIQMPLQQTERPQSLPSSGLTKTSTITQSGNQVPNGVIDPSPVILPAITSSAVLALSGDEPKENEAMSQLINASTADKKSPNKADIARTIASGATGGKETVDSSTSTNDSGVLSSKHIRVPLMGQNSISYGSNNDGFFIHFVPIVYSANRQPLFNPSHTISPSYTLNGNNTITNHYSLQPNQVCQ